MGYSRNFGMRSFENIIRDARFRVPRTGTMLQIGSTVTIDPANPGMLKLPAANANPTAASGLVLFEHIQSKGVDPYLSTSMDEPFNRVPLGQYAQVIHGPGAKVWFKNTIAKPMYDGRTQTAGGLLAASVDVTTLAIGAGLGPDGTGLLAVSTTGTPWLVVEQVNPTTGLVEARFNF